MAIDVQIRDNLGKVIDIGANSSPTYFAYTTHVPAAGAGDTWMIGGNTSKIISLRRIVVSGTAAVAAALNIVIKRRSTATSGGTSANATVTKADTTNGASEATITTWTAAPTAGTNVGDIAAKSAFLQTATPTAPTDKAEFVFGINDQPVIIRPGEYVTINLGGATLATITVSAEWTEYGVPAA
jgi:hypothetical protein